MNSFEMEMDVRQESGIVMIEVSGSINSLHSPRLRQAIASAFQDPVRGIIVDIGQVGYIDSSGLATLVEGIQQTESKEVKFLLAGVLDEKVQHMLEITRLNELFEHFATLDEAKAQLIS